MKAIRAIAPMIKVVTTTLFVQPSELAELNPYNKPPKPIEDNSNER